MPQIIRDSKQDKALETIGEYLAEIGKINSIIASGSYCFLLQSTGGKKVKLDIAPAQNDKVVALLKDRKKDLVKEARSVAKANRIAFDEKEEAAMSEEGHTQLTENAQDSDINEETEEYMNPADIETDEE